MSRRRRDALLRGIRLECGLLDEHEHPSVTHFSLSLRTSLTPRRRRRLWKKKVGNTRAVMIRIMIHQKLFWVLPSREQRPALDFFHIASTWTTAAFLVKRRGDIP